jgi:hypothetical protein
MAANPAHQSSSPLLASRLCVWREREEEAECMRLLVEEAHDTVYEGRELIRKKETVALTS